MPTVKKNNHIRTVLDVSIVDLYAADAFLVTVTPNTLKHAIEQHIIKNYRMILPFADMSWKALVVFSSVP